MSKNLTPIILFLLFSFHSYGQENTALVDSLGRNKVETTPLEFRPQVSLGTGMFTFIGDVANSNNGFHPTVSRLARDLRITQALNTNFDLSFYVLFGQVSANERTLTRNLNFNANITTGGVTVNYNFFHILNPKRKVNPYISLGIESIEFLSKTDLKDKDGKLYHYWSDGSIKDKSENAFDASSAQEIFRDYTYESDLREADIDGFGKYQERTLAIPIDIGANFHLSKRIKARVGTSMHFTFTDLIDNVSDESIGTRKGDKNNDKFLYTHFALTYDFGIKNKNQEAIEEFEVLEEEWLASDTSDYDKDGVVDFLDECIKTPKHAFPVDEKGCPLDLDQDFVPDFRDDEKNTLFGDLVNLKGVTQYDDDLERLFKIYIDSNFYINERHITKSGEDGLPREKRKKSNLKYTIVIGTDSKEVSANDLHKYLSYKDFKTIEKGDSVFYVIGGFESVIEAIKEKGQLEKNGINTESIALINGAPEEIQKILSNKNIKQIIKDENILITDKDKKDKSKTLYRIQLGAFNIKISKEAFGSLNKIEEVKGNDGLYRYYSGAFYTKKEAAEHKIDVLSKGYSNSYLVAFKNGKRITLEDAGFEVKEHYNDIIVESSGPTKEAIKKELIKFRIQIGAYKNDIPTNILDVYLQLGQVLPKIDATTGITKYLVGKFDTYEEANKHKNEIVKKGIIDAFIIGDFNGKMISAREALELTK